ALVIALVAPDRAAALVGLGIVRVETESLVEVGNGAVEIALGVPRQAAIGIDADVGSSGLIDARKRVDANRFGKVGDRAVEVPLLPPSRPALVLSERSRRIEADCRRGIPASEVAAGRAPSNSATG